MARANNALIAAADGAAAGIALHAGLVFGTMTEASGNAEPSGDDRLNA